MRNYHNAMGRFPRHQPVARRYVSDWVETNCDEEDSSEGLVYRESNFCLFFALRSTCLNKVVLGGPCLFNVGAVCAERHDKSFGPTTLTLEPLWASTQALGMCARVSSLFWSADDGDPTQNRRLSARTVVVTTSNVRASYGAKT